MRRRWWWWWQRFRRVCARVGGWWWWCAGTRTPRCTCMHQTVSNVRGLQVHKAHEPRWENQAFVPPQKLETVFRGCTQNCARWSEDGKGGGGATPCRRPRGRPQPGGAGRGRPFQLGIRAQPATPQGGRGANQHKRVTGTWTTCPAAATSCMILVSLESPPRLPSNSSMPPYACVVFTGLHHDIVWKRSPRARTRTRTPRTYHTMIMIMIMIYHNNEITKSQNAYA